MNRLRIEEKRNKKQGKIEDKVLFNKLYVSKLKNNNYFNKNPLTLALTCRVLAYFLVVLVAVLAGGVAFLAVVVVLVVDLAAPFLAPALVFGSTQ